MGGKWEFPGGKTEPGESLEAGLKRELYEEFEIEVAVKDFIGSHPFNNGDKKYELMAFHVEYLSGGFVLNEHTDMKWIEPTEFPEYDFAESDKAIIKILFG